MSKETISTDKPNVPEILDKTFHTVTERLEVFSFSITYFNRI